MKKILAILTLFVLAVPFVAAAQALPNECAISDARVGQIRLSAAANCPGTGNASIDTQGLCCVFNAIYTVTDWIFYVMLTVAIVLIVIGGFMMMTSGGDPAKTGKGRNFILYAAIGLAIGLLARAVPGAVRLMVGTRA